MNPKLENLDINGSADVMTEYTDWFSGWVDTKEPSEEKAIKVFFQSG